MEVKQGQISDVINFLPTQHKKSHLIKKYIKRTNEHLFMFSETFSKILYQKPFFKRSTWNSQANYIRDNEPILNMR